MGGRADPLSVRLEVAQRAAAEEAWTAAAGLLDAGSQAAGLVLIGELLRAVHSCRLAALPRLSAAGTRVAQQIRDLDAQRPQFKLEGLTWDFQELVATAHALRSADEADAKWVGTARRAYAQVGSLELSGMFTEPIVRASGYGGVATYLADPNSVIWSLSDVAPGDAERCFMAYVTPLALGDATVDHRSLCREGLSVQNATAAANRRLGSGRSVSAVSTDGVAWTDPSLVRLWDTPFEVQLDRAWSVRERPIDERCAGDDLLFVRCSVLGAHDDALLLQAGSTTLHGIAPSAHAELRYRHNLAVLATAAELPLLVVGRIAYSRPRTLLLLAIATVSGTNGLRLPEEWNGRVNLGLDVLPSDQARPRTVTRAPAESAEPRLDPLDPLKRRLQQVLLGGHSAVSQTTWSGFERDERLLARNQMPTAAALLRQLRDAAIGEADAATRRNRLARAWLAGRTYVAAAEARLQRLGWLE